MQNFEIRPIEKQDNRAIAAIIRKSLEEFGANKPGTVYYDDSTDHLYELFDATPGSKYFIATIDNVVVGGAGIYPTEALPENTCELVKMYLSSTVRGIGLGGKMISHCLATAKEMGYANIYLETMPELNKAVQVYEKFGFEYLPRPLGKSGHDGCDIWMLKML